MSTAPPEPKTEDKFTKEDKTEHELVRQWRVVIQDIECVNQTANIINPFVKFIIGGNYYVSSRLALAQAADILTN